MKIGNITWTVERRYAEFAKFDRERFATTISKKNSLLPPKKLVGNQVRKHLLMETISNTTLGPIIYR
jgi:hypothetical protein